MRRRSVLCLVFLACGPRANGADLGAAAVQPAKAPPVQARVEEVASDVTVGPGFTQDETLFSIQTGSCQIGWTYHVTGVNEGLAQQRTSGACSLADGLASIEKLLARLLATQRSERRFRTLLLSIGAFPEMAVRMAILAKHSALWDASNGGPRAGSMNAAVGELASQSDFLDGWRELFHRAGLKIARCSVEEVTVERASKLPYFERLRTLGIEASDQVPVSGPLWFELTKE